MQFIEGKIQFNAVRKQKIYKFYKKWFSYKLNIQTVTYLPLCSKWTDKFLKVVDNFWSYITNIQSNSIFLIRANKVINRWQLLTLWNSIGKRSGVSLEILSGTIRCLVYQFISWENICLRNHEQKMYSAKVHRLAETICNGEHNSILWTNQDIFFSKDAPRIKK